MISIVFMVAGMSSRFGGNPKQMAKVGPNNETLIEFSVNQALRCNFNKLIFITNPKTESLFKNIFGNFYKNVPVLYVEQKYNKSIRKRPWGTTDAICSIIDIINEPFIMVNGDDLYGMSTFEKGFNIMQNKNINVIGGLKIINTLPEKGNVNRGVIFVNGNNVIGMKEMLNISKINNPELHNELANVNFIGLQPSILNLLKAILEKFKLENKDDQKIECILPDNLDQLIKEKKLELQFFEITEKILGITNPEDEEILKNLLKEN